MPERLFAPEVERAIEENQRRFRAFKEDPPKAGLRAIDSDLLIPPQMIIALEGEPVRTARMPEAPPRSLREMDNYYERSLNVVGISPNSKLSEKSDETKFKQPFSIRADQATFVGAKKPEENLAFSLIADDQYGSGVHVQSFILNPYLRGYGVGAAFYERFEEVLSDIGYQYIWGTNNVDNAAFFQSIGRTYDSKTLKKMEDRHLLQVVHGYTSVRFLDPKLNQEIEGEE